MNVWIPGLVVVVVGLAAGLWFAIRSMRESPGSGAPAESAVPNPAKEPGEGFSPAAGKRRSGLVGFLAGVATCLAIGGLVYWATQGSRPKDEMPSASAAAALAPMAPQARMAPMAPSPAMAGPATPEATAAAHDESAELSPEVAAELARLRAQVQTAPQDLAARRQLSVALLNANQLMPAFEQAKELQRLMPNDPDGLYVEGVVRLVMGQWPVTVELMTRVLAQHPGHVLAAMAKGEAEAALGRTAEAKASWEKGLAAAGGKFAPIEELLAQAEVGGAPALAGSSPTPVDPVAAAGNAARGMGAPGGTGGSYRVHIELAPGTVAPRGAGSSPAVLFLALRGEAPGPPAAAKRIQNPAFPLELTLSADDSMMGQPLPEKGKLTVHLDGDGNASTQEPGDLTASVQGFSGTPITVILERDVQ